MYTTRMAQITKYTPIIIIPSSSWSPIPDSPTKEGFTITVIDDQLITVGGYRSGDDVKDTNKLFSLTGEGSGRRWTEKFPPMLTKRWGVSTGTALIVAGGYVGRQQLNS